MRRRRWADADDVDRRDALLAELEHDGEDAPDTFVPPTLLEWELHCDYSGDRALDGPATDLFGRSIH